MIIESVNVAKLKASLSAYLQKVKQGEEIVITERGKPVARILPITFPSDMPKDERARLERLAAEGKVRLPLEWPTEEWWDDFLKMPRPGDPEGLVLKALLEEREEGY